MQRRGIQGGTVEVVYYGERTPGGKSLVWRLWRHEDGEVERTLIRHRRRWSRDGPDWGRGRGPGLDLARSLLWAVAHREPEPALCEAFLHGPLASLPPHGWLLAQRDVEAWLKAGREGGLA